MQPAIDKRWQAESDAYTLAQAAEIGKDKKRVSAAKKMAAKMAKDLQREQDKQIKALKTVAKKSVTRKKK